MREGEYQTRLIKELKARFPGILILKNDPDYLQGIPDLSLFFGGRWAMLEVKASERASHQPNQDYYVRMADEMSFAAFIYPENQEAVLDALRQSFAA